MHFQRLTPMLWTRDFEGTVRFYTTHLGFRCETRSDGWASLARDSVRLMISLPNEHLPFQGPSFTGSFYFHVDDVAALWSAFKDTQQVCYPMEDFAYGMREFAIYDNNGYILQFGTALKATSSG